VGRLTLPLADEVTKRLFTAIPNMPNPRNVKLIIIEDDVAQARLLSTALKKCLRDHITVITITDPRHAYKYLRSQWVDIVVTDLLMPEIGGIDILRAAKSRNSCAQVIVLTASSTTESLFEAMEGGAVDYLLKPVDPSTLGALVAQADDRITRWRTSLCGTLERAYVSRNEGSSGSAITQISY
jgi:DNA-binding NtrC family response regulator